MTNDLTKQQAFLLDVQARLQEVEDILMSREWEGIVVRTHHGAFEWRPSAGEEPPGKARRRKPGTRRKPRERR
jgi:hypothetical protein